MIMNNICWCWLTVGSWIMFVVFLMKPFVDLSTSALKSEHVKFLQDFIVWPKCLETKTTRPKSPVPEPKSRFWWESGFSSASRNHLTSVCRPSPTSGVHRKFSWAGSFSGMWWSLALVCAVCDVTLITVLFPNQHLGEVCWHNMHIFQHPLPYFMCHCTELNTSY